MEVGIPQSLSALEKSFLPTGRLSLDSSVIDVKLAATAQFNDKDDEGEIMLLAMILLQLHGVSKLPSVAAAVATATATPTVTVTTTAVAPAPIASSPSPTNTISTSEEENDRENKKKRQRTSPDQLAILETIFQTDKMPNPQTRGQLADQLGMSSRRVQIWFQNKRAKVKRSSLKPDGECSSPTSLGDSSSSIPPPSPSTVSEASEPQPDSPSPSSPSTQASSTTDTNATSPAPSSLKSTPSLTVFTSSTTSTTTSNDTILAETTKQLKAQQQFFLKAPFVENKPLLAASY